MEYHKLQTSLVWNDISLTEKSNNKLEKLKEAIKNEKTYHCLFYGASGTGKTLTAALIGKACSVPILYVPLELLISTYIGETEKNISHTFQKAKEEQAILFFDEADSLFGKRTNVRDSHDRFANQEVSYLLQRIEKHKGISILSTHLKRKNIKQLKQHFNACIRFKRT